MVGFTYDRGNLKTTMRFDSISNDGQNLIGVKLEENTMMAFSDDKVIVNYDDIIDFNSNKLQNPGLLINGDMQVGLYSDSTSTGNKLIFGGCTITEKCPYMQRIDRELAVVIPTSDIDSPNTFQVGSSDGNGNFLGSFFVTDSGSVGIIPQSSDQAALNNSIQTLAANKIPFYVQSHPNLGSEPVVMIHNEGQDSPHSLSLTFSKAKKGEIHSDYDYITFSVGSTSSESNILGTIEGNVAGDGVRFKTGGADYAEYLEKIDVSESIERGDIVGVFDGKISKLTKGAQQVMVHSSGAAVAGNWPGDDQMKYELISFFGQVYVKVVGQVNKGDYIVPSNRNDGTGIAVDEDQLTLAQKQMIVGRAWGSSNDHNEKLVLCAVGLNFSFSGFDQEMNAIESLRNSVNRLSKENQILTSQLDLIKQQDAKIDALIERLSD